MNVTEPADTSATVMKYELFRFVVLGTNAPLPPVVQLPVLVTPLTIPLNPIVLVLEQISWLGPAFTAASVLIETLTVSLTAGQGPLLVDVSVKVTEPFVISAGVNE